MCSIIGSFEYHMLVHLYELNSYRGTHSHSVSVYDFRNKKVLYVDRDMGDLSNTKLSNICRTFPGHYYVVHSQAPTTENYSYINIHPAAFHHTEVRSTSLLWHNGILKPATIKKLREETCISSTWDTQLLLNYMINKGNLSEVDGTFACLMHHMGEMYMFRNEISPLFIDFDMNISSTRFDETAADGGSFSVKPNHVFRLDLFNKHTIIESTFSTKNSPYLLEL